MSEDFCILLSIETNLGVLFLFQILFFSVGWNSTFKTCELFNEIQSFWKFDNSSSKIEKNPEIFLLIRLETVYNQPEVDVL